MLLKLKQTSFSFLAMSFGTLSLILATPFSQAANNHWTQTLSLLSIMSALTLCVLAFSSNEKRSNVCAAVLLSLIALGFQSLIFASIIFIAIAGVFYSWGRQPI